MLTLSSKLRILAKTLFFVAIILPGSTYADDMIYSIDPPLSFKTDVLETSTSSTVIFTSFNIKKQGDKTLLSWSTSYELGNKGFSIERSIDKEDWTDIALVEGQSKSCDYVDYKYVDNQPENGVNYYRVKQLDYTGKYEITKVKSLEFDMDSDKELAPIYAYHKY
jgi:hypothetical protein